MLEKICYSPFTPPPLRGFKNTALPKQWEIHWWEECQSLWKALEWLCSKLEVKAQDAAVEKGFLISVVLIGWQKHQRQGEHEYPNRPHSWKDNQNGLIWRGLSPGVLKTANLGPTWSISWKTQSGKEKLDLHQHDKGSWSGSILRPKSQNWPKIPWKKKREKNFVHSREEHAIISKCVCFKSSS